jgi:hypothetical protein
LRQVGALIFYFYALFIQKVRRIFWKALRVSRIVAVCARADSWAANIKFLTVAPRQHGGAKGPVRATFSRARRLSLRFDFFVTFINGIRFHSGNPFFLLHCKRNKNIIFATIGIDIVVDQYSVRPIRRERPPK